MDKFKTCNATIIGLKAPNCRGKGGVVKTGKNGQKLYTIGITLDKRDTDGRPITIYPLLFTIVNPHMLNFNINTAYLLEGASVEMDLAYYEEGDEECAYKNDPDSDVFDCTADRWIADNIVATLSKGMQDTLGDRRAERHNEHTDDDEPATKKVVINKNDDGDDGDDGSIGSEEKKKK